MNAKAHETDIRLMKASHEAASRRICRGIFTDILATVSKIGERGTTHVSVTFLHGSITVFYGDKMILALHHDPDELLEMLKQLEAINDGETDVIYEVEDEEGDDDAEALS